APQALSFGPDGNLYVASVASVPGSSDTVMRFNGKTGAPLPSLGNSGAVFISAGSGGLLTPLGAICGPDANGDGRQDLYGGSVNLAVGPTASQAWTAVPGADTGYLSGTYAAAIKVNDPRTGGVSDWPEAAHLVQPYTSEDSRAEKAEAHDILFGVQPLFGDR